MTACDGCGRSLAPLVRVVHVRVSTGYVVRPDDPDPLQLDRSCGPDLVLCGDCYQLRTGLAGLLELSRARRGAAGVRW